MALTRVIATVVAAASAASAIAGQASPVGKAIQLLSDLQAKIVKEGEDAQKVYSEFAEWCEERSKQLSFEIKTGKAEVADLKAVIAQETSNSQSLQARLEQLAADFATDEADLKAAQHIRKTEAANFAASEKELVETVSMLQRAIGIIEREMKKGGAAMVQLKSAGGLVQALSALVHAEALSTADAEKITSLLQAKAREDDAGAPAASVYESHSDSILEVLTNLMEEAEDQLDATRKKETQDTHAFALLKQSLEDEMKYGNKEISEAKSGIAAAGSKKAKAEGDLTVTSNELSADDKALGDLHHECMTKAEDFEAETKSRGEELSALAKAKEVLVANVGGAEELSYGLNQVSLLQVSTGSQITTKAALAQFEATRIVRDLARRVRSSALAQLAAQIGSASHSGGDQFAKVKGLIQDMVERLEAEAEADASKKAWCDRNLADMHEKEANKQAKLDKLNAQIDKMSTRSAQLKEEVAALQEGLAKLAASQAEMDKIRSEEKQVFAKNSADMKQGIEGVKLALKVLGEYYASAGKAHDEAEGAGTGIISLLEVVESDFTKGLSQMTADEESSQAAYETQTKENEIEKELAAAREYLGKLHGQCDEKAETFEERKARYEAEIAGLKEALQVLESETALVQRHTVRR
eukprot:CAMPEP_0176037292 /NCGR_PEP_ID=MMETSP0120_2-20121206/18474_1 /TAXON_ID=160619 /ORGANISM="Kryptoperidinium foliaceum, Strain CCMP 1326" /LENGTH=641 /DNA_ID=CAMNT_0017370681 /DNA_START=79 /DNA_END=2000 /DNA_ORIENTATION=+